MSGGEQLEVEVKFLLGDVARLRRRLAAMGAAPVKARLYERNVVFDNEQEQLRREGKLLRLRQDDRARLTYKGEPEAAAMGPDDMKVREELEVEVEDFATLETLLGRIGFAPTLVYEKYRETYRVDGVEIVLDELPFGDFLELEGEEDAIRAVAAELDLPWAERIVADYLQLLERLCAQENLPFSDLTFSNFEGVGVSVADLKGAKAV